MCVQNCIKLSAAVHELSTVRWISDNSRLHDCSEYLWNGSSNRQTETDVIKYDFSTKQVGEL